MPAVELNGAPPGNGTQSEHEPHVTVHADSLDGNESNGENGSDSCIPTVAQIPGTPPQTLTRASSMGPIEQLEEESGMPAIPALQRAVSFSHKSNSKKGKALAMSVSGDALRKQMDRFSKNQTKKEKEEKYQVAISAYLREAERDGPSAKNSYGLGCCYRKIEFYEEALAHLNFSLEMDPSGQGSTGNEGACYHNKAQCLIKLNRFAEAYECYVQLQAMLGTWTLPEKYIAEQQSLMRHPAVRGEVSGHCSLLPPVCPA